MLAPNAVKSFALGTFKIITGNVLMASNEYHMKYFIIIIVFRNSKRVLYCKFQYTLKLVFLALQAFKF